MAKTGRPSISPMFMRLTPGAIKDADTCEYCGVAKGDLADAEKRGYLRGLTEAEEIAYSEKAGRTELWRCACDAVVELIAERRRAAE
jgi:hypothetical protein